jgi:hypothetical protein
MFITAVLYMHHYRCCFIPHLETSTLLLTPIAISTIETKYSQISFGFGKLVTMNSA